MKKRFKNRKEFKLMAEELGFPDQTSLALFPNPSPKDPQRHSPILINNHKRYVKGMLKLSPKEQQEKINMFKELKVQMLRDIMDGKNLSKEANDLVTSLQETEAALAADTVPETTSHNPTSPASQE